MAPNPNPDPNPNSNPNPKDPITDYTKTQRIVLLIDLNPILHLSDQTQFLNSLLSSSNTFLSFPPLSSSLFSFKFFFSSLSPLLSSSKLHRFVPTSSLSFNDASTTLLSLSKALNSLPTLYAHQLFDSLPVSSRALFLAASMRQLVHDYAWDPVVDDSITGTLLNNDSLVVGSNLVVLFSPVCRCIKSLSEFLNVGIEDECLENVDAFCEKFCGFFENVNDAYVGRDIRFSWVDVRYELDGVENKVEIDESKLKCGFFASGVRSLGWGFCSTDSIVLGSALVPFGLIYPKIAISSKVFDYSDNRKTLHAQLSLEILDVSGKPLECKCCDLQLVNLKMSPRNRSKDLLFTPDVVGCEWKNSFWELFGNGLIKIHIKAVQRYIECGEFVGHLAENLVLVCESFGGSKNDQKESSGDFFADRVLEMLAMELGEFVHRKSTPIWQILLSFLYREGYWALVSLSNGSGDSQMGILKPFTVSSALLSIIEDGVYLPHRVHDSGEANLAQFTMKMDNEICKPNIDLKCSDGFIDSQPGSSPSNKAATVGNGTRKKNKNKLNMLQDLTWSAFCKTAFEHSALDLGEVYFSRESNNSKKLKFLKCWMKQIKKSSCSSLILQENSKPPKDIETQIDDRLTSLHQESEQPVSSSASAGENSLTEASRIHDEAAVDLRSETSEAFFSNLSNKIQQGLEFEGVDLGALAERLVKSSIYWLYQKHETESPSASQTTVVKSDDACGRIVPELINLLLREPKDLVAKHKNNDSSFQASDPGCFGFGSKDIVREYPFSFSLISASPYTTYFDV